MDLKRQTIHLVLPLALMSLVLFSGCQVTRAVLIANHATCTVKVTAKSVHGSCELINGVFFEKLTVLQKDNSGMPAEYIVTERFKCYNPGVDGVQKYWPDKIYFQKMNGHYKWKADTVNVHFKVDGHSRTFAADQKKPNNYTEGFILNAEKYDTCPIRFQAETWYRIQISDPRLTNVYLYIDKKNSFHVYQWDSGVSPI